jgi:hypothetical protein
MEHPVGDFHDELSCRDELTYRNAKTPASCGGRVATLGVAMALSAGALFFV